MSDRQTPESRLELAESLGRGQLSGRRRANALVLAESCTGGLAAAALATIPGISRWFCGSAVTYRDQTKIDWLAVCRIRPGTRFGGQP